MRSASIIAAGQQLIGTVAGTGDLRVDGHLEGSVAIDGHLAVGEQALILAETVEAHSIRIDGRVEAQVRAKTEVAIGSRGCLIGDVVGCLTVEEGGVFQGRITEPATPGQSGTPRAERADTVPAIPPVHPDSTAKGSDRQAATLEESSLPRPRLKKPHRLTQTFPPGTPAPKAAAAPSDSDAPEESAAAELGDDWFQ